MKRLLDIFISMVMLVIILPLFVFLLFIYFVVEKKWGIIALPRIGKFEKPFKMYKFQTLKENFGSSIVTKERDTNRLGGFLRKSKLDELPQLFNVIIGDMSLVGPRPDVEEIVALTPKNERLFLKIKPGITGPAQIKYKNEVEILNLQKTPEDYYKTIIWPDKVKINNNYYKENNILLDIYYIFQTIF